jgi:hypothetical protein
LVLKKELWDLFTDRRVKTILVNRVIELLPEKRSEILDAAK